MHVRLLPRCRTIGASAAMIAVAIAGCGRSAPSHDQTVQPLGVSVQRARLETIRDVASASGVVLPSAAGDWTILAPEPAQIVSLPRAENDPVEIGDMLVQLEVASVTQELILRQAAVTEATARAERAKADFTRLTSLFERGIASRNAYEAARGEQSTSESMLGQAVAQLDAVKAAQARATLRARFPGVVVNIWHREGDFVSGAIDDPILRVIDPTRLQVAVQLPVPQLARILPGQAAVVRAIAGEGPLAGSVASKPGTNDPNAPTGEVRIGFADASTLAVNTPVSVEILLDQRTDAVVVPIQALLKDDLSSFVVVAGDDGLAHRRDVRTGLITRDLAQIVSGLLPGERVVVGGLQDVSDGTPIAFTE